MITFKNYIWSGRWLHNWLFTRLCLFQKMIAIDLSTQKTLDADPKAIQKIHFTGNIDQAGIITMFFII